MKREFAEQFNREVDNYRKALLYYARKCDWATFEDKAGRLFDYVETVEFRELERRFYRVFSLVLGLLVLVVIGLFSVNFEGNQELMRLKNVVILSSLAVTSFELYFYVGYRRYLDVKTRYYGKRREKFVRGIERDFQGYAVQTEQRAA
jgi:hypothetical protein